VLQDAAVDRNRTRWPVIVGSAFICGTAVFFLRALANRYVFGDTFDWGSAAGTAGTLAIAWCAIGVAARHGWMLPSQRRRRDGR
jgi:hypothetical protein